MLVALLTPTGAQWADHWDDQTDLLREMTRGGWLGLLLVGPCLACGASLHAHDGTIRLEHPNPAALLGAVLRLLEQRPEQAA